MRSNRELKQGRFLPAFVNRKWTFSITGQFFFFFFFCSHFCAQIYLRITTLSYTNLIASRKNYKRKTHVRRSETPNNNDNVNDDTILV